MLTVRTKFALALLHDISRRDYRLSNTFNYPASESAYLLSQLESKQLICRIPDTPMGIPSSYQLFREYMNISLLDVLEAIGEGLYFNTTNQDNFYCYYGTTARKLGIVNQMTRLYLSEIHVTEIPVETLSVSV